MNKIVLMLLLALTGCGSMEQQLRLEATQRKDDSVKTYLATNQPAVDSGAIKRSAFYNGLVDALGQPPTSSIDMAYMSYYADLALLSENLEVGKITKTSFDTQLVDIDIKLKNSIMAINQQRGDLTDARHRAAMSMYYEGTSRMQSCNSYSTNVTCRP